VLELVSETSTSVKLNLEFHDFGGCAIDNHGETLPASTLEACQQADAILLGE
jgi:3-isopropylmalate dehydrogenase